MLALGFLAYLSVFATAEGPRAYVRYENKSDTVIASVYWNGEPGYGFWWANDMKEDGSDLDWQPVNDIHTNDSTYYAKVTMVKYKNYYFKIAKGTNVTIVRAFPGDINSDKGPSRKSNDYAHGNFTPDTTMCGSCHDTHNSLKSQLLKQSTYYDLCMLCHSNSSSQSKYDVETGRVYMGPDVGWVDSLAGPIGTGIATSAHDVNDHFNTTVQVPGGSPDRLLTFTCVSCHTAHGDTDDNYRLIRKQIYPSNDESPLDVNFKAFSIVKSNTVGEQVYYVSGASEFCISCHKDYAPAAGNDDHLYDHPVTVGASVYSVFFNDPLKNLFPSPGDNLPLQYDSESNIADKRTTVVCETCHYAHGTRRSFVINDSSKAGNLLRLDNYGVCQSCHKK